MSSSFFASQRVTMSKNRRTHLDHFLGNIAFMRPANVDDLAQQSERQAALSGLSGNQSSMPSGNSRTRYPGLRIAQLLSQLTLTSFCLPRRRLHAPSVKNCPAVQRLAPACVVPASRARSGEPGYHVPPAIAHIIGKCPKVC